MAAAACNDTDNDLLGQKSRRRAIKTNTLSGDGKKCITWRVDAPDKLLLLACDRWEADKRCLFTATVEGKVVEKSIAE